MASRGWQFSVDRGGDHPGRGGSRAEDLDTTVAALAASQAKFTPLVTMPDPVGLQSVQAITTANLFRDMSGLSTMSQVLAKGIEAAANSDKADAKA
ncbi:hypothetical protein ACIBCA_03785 [Kitasatospora sp. NPDC051170]|uniref:hypothetical protein n=1 Tax=Kitasatospora sp. NPDC051170 TaxID=3364056 RepID=UPI0037B25451